SALGADEVAATKTAMGMDPTKSFDVPAEVLEHARDVVARGQALHAAWRPSYDAWSSANPEALELLERMRERKLPAGWESALPTFEPSEKGIATRAASGKVLTAIAPLLPELWGGSADLAESNNTTPEGQPSFLPEDRQTKAFTGGPYGRVLHFGIREHAMGAILNGIALHGGTRPYGGTFLTFSDYMRGAVRLAAIMKLPVTYVWTHDSIGLGEDGPTHQPIEHLAALRAIPGLDIVRPADANETVVAWRTILEQSDRPAGLILSRQNLPIVDRSVYAAAEGVAKGGYILADAGSGRPEAIIIATGSEVSIAMAARLILEEQGTPTRVVSMPCVEWFREQEQSYQQLVLPPDVLVRASVEAAVTMGWREFVGDHGEMLGLDHYGASAPAPILFEQFGLTPDRVVAAVRSSISKVGATKGSTTGN
ncbi:MAG: transketolase, partial [Frankiaceae bacterium]|nr:transketolase [Frankiaceae bacterium]